MAVIRTQRRQATTDDHRQPSEAVTCQFVVIRDDREERAGWDFSGMVDRKNKRDYALIVPVRKERLETGDYTIAGLVDAVTIERKSLSDLFGSVVSSKADPTRRERFKAEHERMGDMVTRGGFACVIIEASFSEVWEAPPIDSGTNPNAVLGTMFAWMTRYRVPWLFGGSRRGAEVMAFRFLRSAWESLRDRNQTTLF